MKILLVEDNATKATEIEALIRRELGPDKVELLKASTVNESVALLGSGGYDVVIVDLVLPQIRGSQPIDASDQWCELIDNHIVGRTASWIVMTAFADVAESARRSFARHNVAVISYDSSDVWQRILKLKLRDSYEMRPLDFVVICALDKERRGFQRANCSLGDLESIAGLDCQLTTIGELRGAIVLLPGPGLISAAICATKAVSVLRPRAIAMSGICGGCVGESELGALVVPDISWNYQRGKFKSGKLISDPLQVAIPPTVRVALSQMLSEKYAREIREGLMHSDLSKAPIVMAAMVSGSQVVADEAIVAIIGEQSRKAAALDMEVASVFFAAQDFYDGGGIYFAAKTVVDMASPDKDDRYHEYGAALSARFVVDALCRILTPRGK